MSCFITYIPVANYKYLWASRVILGSGKHAEIANTPDSLHNCHINARTRTHAYTTAQTHDLVASRTPFGRKVSNAPNDFRHSMCYTTLWMFFIPCVIQLCGCLFIPCVIQLCGCLFIPCVIQLYGCSSFHVLYNSVDVLHSMCYTTLWMFFIPCVIQLCRCWNNAMIRGQTGQCSDRDSEKFKIKRVVGLGQENNITSKLVTATKHI